MSSEKSDTFYESADLVIASLYILAAALESKQELTPHSSIFVIDLIDKVENLERLYESSQK